MSAISASTRNFSRERSMRVTAWDVERRWGTQFRCRLCGHKFVPGDFARWVYANFKDSPFSGGNFWCCADCWTGSDKDVLVRANRDYQESKQWCWWLWDRLSKAEDMRNWR